MELESYIRPGSDIANARQKQSRDDLLIRRSLMNALSHLLEQIRLWGFLDQANQRFDSRVELHQSRCHPRFLRQDGRHTLKKREISKTESRPAHSCDSHKLPACRFVLHDLLRKAQGWELTYAAMASMSSWLNCATAFFMSWAPIP